MTSLQNDRIGWKFSNFESSLNQRNHDTSSLLKLKRDIRVLLKNNRIVNILYNVNDQDY